MDIPAVPWELRGIGANSLRYVIHTRDSKSSRNARGHVDCASESSSSGVCAVAAAASGFWGLGGGGSETDGYS